MVISRFIDYCHGAVRQENVLREIVGSEIVVGNTIA